MATATMGLRRRVNVNNSPTPTNQQTPPSTSGSTSSNTSGKRSRTENNNSPSHGNLNSLNIGGGTNRDEPPVKKSRGTGTGSSAKTRAHSPAVTESTIERCTGNHGSAKGRNNNSGGKSNSRTKSPSITTIAATTSNNIITAAVKSSSQSSVPTGQQVQPDMTSNFNVLSSNAWPAGNSMPDPTTYTSMSGLNISGPGQTGLCPSGSLGLPSSIPYMATSMATFVGNATNLNKNSSVSYLDISNMTGGGSLNSNSSAGINTTYACKTTVNSGNSETKGNVVPLPFSGVVPTSAGSSATYVPKVNSQTSQSPGNDVNAAVSAKTFQNDGMFNAYQPWVIKTYGDLAKTKTITIKKYARILRTLKGEEVNSAENSKFRFWVKSKGFHIGQPVGYDAKPADRIVGRHAVTSPGLDPPLYVPTQLPHNKSLNGAEGTVPPGRVYKKVAIVENFFDIIHAVHVDLEGRPGKHAGQKRTYRTITETYAFLPREAVTRFLLGCTECQRRPRTPSPSNLSNQSQVTSGSSVQSVTGTLTVTGTPTSTTTTTTPLSPIPAATALSASQPFQSSPKPREASNPPESKSLYNYRHAKHQQRSCCVLPAVTPEKLDKERDKEKDGLRGISASKERHGRTTERDQKQLEREEKYNPLSITNLLKKEPGFEATTRTNDSNHPTDSRSTPESDRASSRSSASSKRKRMLPEGRTPSPQPTLPLPRPWSPGLDPKNTPIDYSLPITTAYLKHQQRIQAEKNKAAALILDEPENAELETGQDSALISTMSEAEIAIDRDRFSPAAGLIDTNLNLLATIQHLHCQVMLALTERLRPSVIPASLMLPPGTGVLPNILMGTEFSMSTPMAQYHS